MNLYQRALFMAAAPLLMVAPSCMPKPDLESRILVPNVFCAGGLAQGVVIVEAPDGLSYSPPNVSVIQTENGRVGTVSPARAAIRLGPSSYLFIFSVRSPGDYHVTVAIEGYSTETQKKVHPSFAEADVRVISCEWLAPLPTRSTSPQPLLPSQRA